MTPEDEYAARSGLALALAELDHLGAAWLEARVAGRSTARVDEALDEARRLSRRYERKLRKAGLEL